MGLSVARKGELESGKLNIEE